MRFSLNIRVGKIRQPIRIVYSNFLSKTKIKCDSCARFHLAILLSRYLFHGLRDYISFQWVSFIVSFSWVSEWEHKKLLNVRKKENCRNFTKILPEKLTKTLQIINLSSITQVDLSLLFTTIAAHINILFPLPALSRAFLIVFVTRFCHLPSTPQRTQSSLGNSTPMPRPKSLKKVIVSLSCFTHFQDTHLIHTLTQRIFAAESPNSPFIIRKIPSI